MYIEGALMSKSHNIAFKLATDIDLSLMYVTQHIERYQLFVGKLDFELLRSRYTSISKYGT